jgi:hypothetical protein
MPLIFSVTVCGVLRHAPAMSATATNSARLVMSDRPLSERRYDISSLDVAA